jgi:hypothetical protein
MSRLPRNRSEIDCSCSTSLLVAAWQPGGDVAALLHTTIARLHALEQQFAKMPCCAQTTAPKIPSSISLRLK